MPPLDESCIVLGPFPRRLKVPRQLVVERLAPAEPDDADAEAGNVVAVPAALECAAVRRALLGAVREAVVLGLVVAEALAVPQPGQKELLPYSDERMRRNSDAG